MHNRTLPFIGGLVVGALAHKLLAPRKPWSALFGGDRMKRVLESHEEYLLVRHPDHHKKFVQLLGADSQAAMAEAAVFALLKNNFRLRPEPSDIPGTGGIDFICRPPNTAEFSVEVTVMQPETVARRSGIPTKIDDRRAFAFSQITKLLTRKAIQKAKQLADYPHPTVLAIATAHQAVSFLLDTMSAQWLLNSEPRIRIPVGVANARWTLTTDLDNSVFFKPHETENRIIPCRQSISAILLIGIYDTEDRMVGLLHPEPIHKLDIDHFKEVPFIRIAKWPIVEGAIETEWVVSQPQQLTVWHRATKLSDSELRGVEV